MSVCVRRGKVLTAHGGVCASYRIVRRVTQIHLPDPGAHILRIGVELVHCAVAHNAELLLPGLLGLLKPDRVTGRKREDKRMRVDCGRAPLGVR